jgi:hypothetical protein
MSVPVAANALVTSRYSASATEAATTTFVSRTTITTRGKSVFVDIDALGPGERDEIGPGSLKRAQQCLGV